MATTNNRRRTARSGNLLTANLKRARGTIFRDWVLRWSNQNFTKSGNVPIKVEDQMYHLHSQLLSFWTDYFDSLFTSEDVVNLPNLKKSNFDIIVNFLYNGALLLDSRNVKDILFVADELRIESIIEACCHFIVVHLSEIQNIVDVLDLLCRGNLPLSIIKLRSQIIEKWNRIYHMDTLRVIFLHHIPELESIVDILEFLSHSSQQWMLEIRKQIIRKSNLIYSTDVLQKVSVSVLKNILCENVNTDRDILEICQSWVSADIVNRFRYLPELVNTITGREVDFHQKYHVKFHTEDIRGILSNLLTSYFHEKNRKIQFLELFELTINPTNKPVIVQMLVQPTIEQLYLKHWCRRMKILRYSTRKSDITVKVENTEFPLDSWVLSISSKFFHETPDSTLIELEIQKQDFESVLNFMYGKVLRINSKNLQNILRASRYLRMNSCEALVHEYMKENLSKLGDLFQLLNICSHQHDKIYNLVKNQVVKNFSTIDKQLISSLHVDSLKPIVSSSVLPISNEDRLAICQEWTMYDILNRWIYGPELIKSISRYINDDDIGVISKFNFKLREHLRVCLFEVGSEHEDKDCSIIDFVGRPFVIKLPSIKPCPKGKESSRNVVKFGLNFYIKLPSLKCKSI